MTLDQVVSFCFVRLRLLRKCLGNIQYIITLLSLDELARKTKAKTIERALAADSPDVEQLQQLALSRGGLLNDQLRMEVWPIIVGVDVSENPKKPG